MYHLNFLKVGIATPNIKVGNLEYNANEIIATLNSSKAGVVLFPELNLTSLYAGDLFLHNEFLDNSLKQAKRIIDETTFKGFFTIGMPLLVNNNVYNVVLVVANKKLIGVVPKEYIPPHQKRYFNLRGEEMTLETVMVKLFEKEVPFSSGLIFTHQDIKIAIEIGESAKSYVPQSSFLASGGANIILNPSNDPELLHGGNDKLQRIITTSKRLTTAYIYASPSSTESTSEFVYAGDMIAAVNGELIDEASNLFDNLNYLEVDIDLNYLIKQRAETWFFEGVMYDEETIEFKLPKSKDYQFEYLDTHPFFGGEDTFDSCNAINHLLIQALIKKLESLPEHLRKVIIGVSGGADSTLALLVAEQALERMGLPPTNLIGVSMPSENSSQVSSKRAVELIDGVKATKFVIPIDEQLKVHLKSINHDKKDVTYENAQARIRTNILMDLSNKHGGIVLGPSDLSEIALGFTTYSGDANSMYGINSGLPKTYVLEMLKYYSHEVYIDLAKVIGEIADTPPSPELLKNQVTEDIIGSYVINDFILYHFLKSAWSKEIFELTIPQAFDITKEEAKTYINRFFKRFYQNQFKRIVLPEGPNVLGFTLNPRNGFLLPGDNEVE